MRPGHLPQPSLTFLVIRTRRLSRPSVLFFGSSKLLYDNLIAQPTGPETADIIDTYGQATKESGLASQDMPDICGVPDLRETLPI